MQYNGADRPTNQLELHVNQEVKAELMREHLLTTTHAHLNSLYQACADRCIEDVQPIREKENICLGACY